MSNVSVFSSEAVGKGHPDKVADQIADAVLDAYLAQDPFSKVACEVFLSKNKILIGGEITCQAQVDIDSIVASVIDKLGYNDVKSDFHHQLPIENVIHQQQAQLHHNAQAGGAGDQGFFFGYACDEHPSALPIPFVYAHQLIKTLHQWQEKTQAPIGTDCKTQIVASYTNALGHYCPQQYQAVVLSCQHAPHYDLASLSEDIQNNVIFPVLKDTPYWHDDVRLFINPAGNFHQGGPAVDTGLTGRKLISDSYGGFAHHGGGAWSGKDASKVDRSASYFARYLAKNILHAAGLHRVEVSLGYAIGETQPLYLNIDTFGQYPLEKQEQLAQKIVQTIDCSPENILKTLELDQPVYEGICQHGHFTHPQSRWEQLDLVDPLERLFSSLSL